MSDIFQKKWFSLKENSGLDTEAPKEVLHIPLFCSLTQPTNKRPLTVSTNQICKARSMQILWCRRKTMVHHRECVKYKDNFHTYAQPNFYKLVSQNEGEI